MAEPQPSPTEPLIRRETAVNFPAVETGRSTRAYKVAGFTLLGCALILGQAVIAYIVLSQRSDIQALEAQSNKLKAQLVQGRSAGGVRMAIDSSPLLQIDALDEADTSDTPGTLDSELLTDCQKEAAGLKQGPLPYFKPRCDGRGLYHALQCFGKHCWCVNPENGVEIPGAMRNGPSDCSSAIFAGQMDKMPLLTGITDDETQW